MGWRVEEERISRLVERQRNRGVQRVDFQDRRLKRSGHEASVGAMGWRVERRGIL